MSCYIEEDWKYVYKPDEAGIEARQKKIALNAQIYR